MTTDHTTARISDELAAQLTDYLDGEMAADERSRFEALLEEDADLRAELEAVRSTLGALRELPMQFAPNGFVGSLESRVRTRSRGRFFAQEILYSQRVPYEVFAAVMLAIMAALYLVSLPDRPEIVEDLAMGAGQPPDSPDDAKGEALAPADQWRGSTVPEKLGREADHLPKVLPLKREGFQYTLTITAADPAAKAVELTRRVRATSATYQVQETSEGLLVTLAPNELDDFLEAWAGQGELTKTRVELSDKAPSTTVRLLIRKDDR